MLSRALALAAVAVCASAQAVVSTHSGLVHYFEGAVYLDDQPLQPHLGTFPSMADGAELRTAKGRAEVLLTPGVFLRLDENSAVRMLSNSLADTRVELLSGSAMVDSADPDASPSQTSHGVPLTGVTLTYKNWQVQLPQRGVYRVDSMPPQVWVREGQARVSDGPTGNVVPVEGGMDLPLAVALVPEQSADQPGDAFANWTTGRQESISADNQIAANIQDPASLDPGPLSDADLANLAGLAGFTQFPMLGLSPLSAIAPGAYGPGVYSSLYPYQPGFYSLYLPGYTYQPLFLALPLVLSPAGLRSPVYSPYSTLRPGVSTIMTPHVPTSVVRPYSGVRSYPGIRATPMARPTPMPTVRPMPRVGGRR